MIQHFYIAFVLLMLFLQDLFIFASFGCKACLFYWKITLTVWGGGGAIVYKSSCFVYFGQKSIHILDYSQICTTFD